jgi:asparagine synthetase B (glutamine-hydrolysing)
MIAGYGMLAFRDPFGIRPLIFGTNETPEGTEYLFASESVALDTLGFQGAARRRSGRGDLHRSRSPHAPASMRAQFMRAFAVHFRVRLSGSPGLGDRRRLGL